MPPRESCDFMTMECADNCGYQVNEFEMAVLKKFLLDSASNIKLKIRDELRQHDCKIVTWFATGDCLDTLTDKTTEIMDWLSEEGFIQCGFTRNKQLWANTLTMNNVELGLTVEDEKTAEMTSKRGLVAVPDYTSWTVKLYKGGRGYFSCGGGFSGGCGAGFFTINGEIYPEDCGMCHDNSRGCFSK